MTEEQHTAIMMIWAQTRGDIQRLISDVNGNDKSDSFRLGFASGLSTANEIMRNNINTVYEKLSEDSNDN